MKVKTKNIIKTIGFPAYQVYRRILHWYCMKNSKKLIDKKFYSKFHRHINWEHPSDLNEIINWQKFHADMHQWAMLADKYAVRNYVAEHGLSDILIPLIGKYDTVKEFLKDWDKFPNEFVIKSNNGCGHIIIISAANGGKESINKKTLSSDLKLWLAEYDYGIKEGEFQYQYIKNCIIVEELLKDESFADFSSTPVDYKFHCLNGKPYICYVSYGRSLGENGEHKRVGNLYDMEWKDRSDLMATSYERMILPKPINWDRMLEISSILSEGNPQARIDLYNIKGRIYFGEITMTNCGGFDTEYKQELYRNMGQEVIIDYSMPQNEFAH